MNSDAQRNQHYGDAISAQVRPGDRVMDLGAGLGMLGFMAARRGAAVHFVEPEDILEVPRQMAAAEGRSEERRVGKAWSERWSGRALDGVHRVSRLATWCP